jgi:hypothetical protein
MCILQFTTKLGTKKIAPIKKDILRKINYLFQISKSNLPLLIKAISCLRVFPLGDDIFKRKIVNYVELLCIKSNAHIQMAHDVVPELIFHVHATIEK